MSPKLTPLLNEEQIKRRIRELAREIEGSLKGDFLVVGVLKGSFIFLADLIREFSRPVEVDFIQVSSYGSSTRSSGKVKLIKDLECEVKDRCVLLVDDILDTGLTLKELVRHLEKKGAREVKVCVLLDKREGRKVPFEAHFVGFNVPNHFLVGYGLDYAQKYRNLRGIFRLDL